jgi:two-component system NarL family response regulator
MKSAEAIRLIVADDHPVFREGLVLILNNQEDMKVVGDCDNGGTAVDLVLALRPDVAVLDLKMPVLNGAAATAAILEKVPGAHILLLTTFDGDQDINRAIQAGARGYLLKESDTEEVLLAIREISKGRRYLSLAVGASLSAASISPQLTKRELEILTLVSDGKANKEIASGLNISEGTVKTHVHAITQKLNVTSRTEAALAAQRRGLLRN